MRVLITGSRDWTNEKIIRRELKKLPPDSVVIEGGAKGADRIAYKQAKLLGLEVETFPADWEGLGKKAGPIRNQQMVDSGADLCLAFPKKGSRGTWDCVRRAFFAGIYVRVVFEVT